MVFSLSFRAFFKCSAMGWCLPAHARTLFSGFKSRLFAAGVISQAFGRHDLQPDCRFSVPENGCPADLRANVAIFNGGLKRLISDNHSSYCFPLRLGKLS